MQVLQFIADGHANKTIAATLRIGEPAVKAVVSRLLTRFELPNRASLATAATVRQVLGEAQGGTTWLPYLFSKAPVMIALVRGPRLVFELVNPAYAHAVGERQLIGRTIREAFPEFAGTGMIEQLESAYRTGESVVGHEFQASRKAADGSIEDAGIVNFVWQPVRGRSGNIEGLITFGIDATRAVDTVADRRRRTA